MLVGRDQCSSLTASDSVLKCTAPHRDEPTVENVTVSSVLCLFCALGNVMQSCFTQVRLGCCLHFSVGLLTYRAPDTVPVATIAVPIVAVFSLVIVVAVVIVIYCYYFKHKSKPERAQESVYT